MTANSITADGAPAPGLLRDLPAQWRNARWALERVRRRHPRLFASQVAVMLVQSFEPAAIAVAIQHVVDGILNATSHPERGTGAIVFWVLVAFAISLAEV